MTKAIALALFASLRIATASSPWRYHHQQDGHLSNGGWNGWGGDLSNSRKAHHSALGTSNAHSVRMHCKIEYTNGVSATPNIDGDIAYYPTWGGSLVALNYKTCQTVWETNITQAIKVGSLMPCSYDQAID